MTSTHIGAGALFTLDPTRAYPVLARADGIRLWDDAGNEYLDAIAGIAVANVGYGRQEVVDAIAEQAARLPYAVGNIFASEPADRPRGRDRRASRRATWITCTSRRAARRRSRSR